MAAKIPTDTLFAATYIDQEGIHRTWTGGLSWADAHKEDSDLRDAEPDARGYEVVPQVVADARQGRAEGKTFNVEVQVGWRQF